MKHERLEKLLEYVKQDGVEVNLAHWSDCLAQRTAEIPEFADLGFKNCPRGPEFYGYHGTYAISKFYELSVETTNRLIHDAQYETSFPTKQDIIKRLESILS